MVPTLDGAHSPPGPVPSSLSGSEPEDEGRALLHSSAPGYLSDDGTTPLVGKVGGAGCDNAHSQLRTLRRCLCRRPQGPPPSPHRTQPAPPRRPQDRLSRRQQLLHWSRMALRFLLAQWLKFLILGIIITLIVLVSVKVRRLQGLRGSCSLPFSAGAYVALFEGAWRCRSLGGGQLCCWQSGTSAAGRRPALQLATSMPARCACLQGFSIFGVILRWFQARNNWAGWGIFIGMYCAVVALFLPGIAFIMGAGFVFG